MTKQLVVKAPAKINLTLDVIRKRPDGYHDIETVMQQISLCDIVYLKLIKKGIRLNLNVDGLPTNEENLAYQAAELLMTHYKINGGVEIYIEKNIPVGAGLAGGSSNAAAVLKGMDGIFELKIASDKMLKWGALLGSDVPFCIMGGTALATGRGEVLKPLPSEILFNLLIVKPPRALSTATIFNNFDQKNVKLFPDTRGFIGAWGENRFDQLLSCMENVLESVSISFEPEIELIKRQLMNLGASKALMSGSGPSVFAIFDNQTDLEKAYQIMILKYEQCFKAITYMR